jgi:hypothetical protein
MVLDHRGRIWLYGPAAYKYKWKRRTRTGLDLCGKMDVSNTISYNSVGQSQDAHDYPASDRREVVLHAKYVPAERVTNDVK